MSTRYIGKAITHASKAAYVAALIKHDYKTNPFERVQS